MSRIIIVDDRFLTVAAPIATQRGRQSRDRKEAM
jgi:hypothetical protein